MLALHLVATCRLDIASQTKRSFWDDLFLAVLALGDGFLGKFRGTSPMKIVSTRIMSIEVFFGDIPSFRDNPTHDESRNWISLQGEGLPNCMWTMFKGLDCIAILQDGHQKGHYRDLYTNDVWIPVGWDDLSMNHTPFWCPPKFSRDSGTT